MAATLQVGSVGTTLQWTVKNQDGTPVDLSTATLTLYLVRSDHSMITKTNGTGVSGTSGGLLSYDTVTGDLHKPGPLAAQAVVAIGADSIPTDIRNYEVLQNLFG